MRTCSFNLLKPVPAVERFHHKQGICFLLLFPQRRMQEENLKKQEESVEKQEAMRRGMALLKCTKKSGINIYLCLSCVVV